jgi:catechol 2,3-dioxygenase-like lactoylglutathione lyase family enzyme
VNSHVLLDLLKMAVGETTDALPARGRVSIQARGLWAKGSSAGSADSVYPNTNWKPPSILHHVSLGIRDLKLSSAFYDAALGALGFYRVFEDETAVGYGLVDGQDLLCLKLRPAAAAPGAGFHLAFSAPSRSAVDAFHQAALRVGGHDNGPPGLRPNYGPHYYAAFLIDPDGHHIEAVTNVPLG